MTLTAKSWNYLFNAFDTFKAWDTLECCDFNGINLMDVKQEDVSKSMTILLKRCRFVQQFSLSNWVQSIPIEIDSFSISSSLSHLILQKHNFTEPFSDTARLPSNIYYIDVSQSSFTLASLQSFFNLKSSIGIKPISLNLADLSMPQNSWSSFYSSLSSFKNIKSIIGLD